MDYTKLIAVTGFPGLYELINSKTDGAIIRSLEDGATRFVSTRIHNFSHLESIEVFTTRENVNLSVIFQAMEKSGTNLPDEKDPAALKKYFEKTYPEIDFERVYNSDLKKMIKWFSLFQKNKIEIKLPETEVKEEVKKEPVAEKEPEKKTAATKEDISVKKKSSTDKKK
ncbi:MAG TPA: DUF5606 domain-containing protein [Chitinophagaceae bacterium]|nr:DUF5606 domain-containing protein [Chitinophagaceae bacterium]